MAPPTRRLVRDSNGNLFGVTTNIGDSGMARFSNSCGKQFDHDPCGIQRRQRRHA